MALLFAKGTVIYGVRRYSGCIHVNDAYIVGAGRTPIGSFQGKFASLTAVQLGTKALIGVIEKSCIEKYDIQEIVLGQSFHAGGGPLPPHQVAMFSGLKNSIVASTVSKLCGSGMKAIINAAQSIATSTNEVVVAGGIESVTHIPYILRRQNLRYGHICLKDLLFNDGFTDIYSQLDVNAFAEETAKEFKFTRECQDNYALESYRRAAKAVEENIFTAEIIPVTLKTKKGEEETICEDEEIRRLNVDKFRSLPPDMGKGGTITVGNSSGINDGAAMLILASGSYVMKKNLDPLARIVSYAEDSLEPKKFVLSPSVAIPKALVKANLSASDICLWEISETFSVTPLANMRILNLDHDKVNVNGGAVSLGHPFGMTGVRIVGHLAHVLPPGAFGCAAISFGTGGGSAIIIEKMA